MFKNKNLTLYKGPYTKFLSPLTEHTSGQMQYSEDHKDKVNNTYSMPSFTEFYNLASNKDKRTWFSQF